MKIEKRRIIMGVVLGAAALVICSIWYHWQMGVAFLLMFAVAGCLSVRTRHPLVNFALNGLWGVVSIYLMCCIAVVVVGLYPQHCFWYLNRFRIIMNMICAAIVYGAVLTVAGRIKPTVAIASGLLMLLVTVNGFVYQFRGNELRPADILSVKTAMNVVDGYRFVIERGMAYGWMLWIWQLFCLGSMPEERPVLPGWLLRSAAAVLTVVFSWYAWNNVDLVPMKMYKNSGTIANGYYLSFVQGLRTCIITEPENYDQEIEDLQARYQDIPNEEKENLPNVVVIMNESYADMNRLGDNFNPSQTVSPFIDSLKENTIRGYALSSAYGGNTANAEYEFLTGNSMAWLPSGSVPYQEHIWEDSYSLARLLKSMGYSTAATHPYLATGWSRPKVYPFFGFETSTFVDDYPQEQMIRTFVSDQEMYEFVLDTLDNSGEQPAFLFGITMQNHGDYEIVPGANDTNFRKTISLNGYTQEYPLAETYLSLINETDKATEYFIKQLEAYPEDTVVLFFGDHYPRLEKAFYEEVHGGEYETLSEQQLQYSVPFFIWANYDIPEQTVECTSLSYLGQYLLEAAGIELPPYYRFLKDLETHIPAINALGYYSVSQQTYLPLNEAEGEEALWLNRYRAVQYNNIFDPENHIPAFFGRYLPNAAS